MKRFVKTPSLPDDRVSTVIVSGIKDYIVSELDNLGISVIQSKELSMISGSERHHADMSFCHAGGEHIFAACNTDEKVRKRLLDEGAKLHITDSPVTAAAPLLNIRILGTKVLCNTKTADRELIELQKEKGSEILHTNQGYTACSTAVISSNALITADESIYRLCINSGIDVLKISCGSIELEGYPYGFIGGCCGLISGDTLAFSGNIRMHPDYDNIRAFARQYGKELLSLSDKPLYDIGGIIPLLMY